MKKAAGILYGVGVGPGDPELITLKAVRVLQSVDIVVAPGKERSIALEIAKPYVQGDVIELRFPMGLSGAERERALDENERVLRGFLNEGKKIAFITLGDPMTYSTFAYMAERLKDFQIEIVPGINSFSAAAARLKLPLAEGDESLAVIPAFKLTSLDKVLDEFENVVAIKISSHYDEVLELFSKKGFYSALSVRCGHEGEIATFEPERYKGQKVDYLSLLIGKKVKK